MQSVLLLIHLFIAIVLVGVVLVQRSEGGALGIGGGGGGLMSTRGSANLLTRATAVLAACFIVTSLLLAILAGTGKPKQSILEAPSSAPTAPATPAGPAVPLAK
jgi:preprotein translocase subunit SecG